jgi:hypothetical protein
VSSDKFLWVTLKNREGESFQRVRIPYFTFQPLILQWGARYYLRQAGELDYQETDCFFVTLASQYPQTAEERRAAATGGREW